MNNIKALFIDSEGTIRDQNHFIKDEIKEAIDELKKEGIYVIITSGLPRFLIRKIQKESHASDYIICSNGADIYNVGSNKSIYSEYLNHELICGLLRQYNNKFIFILGKGDCEYATSICEYNKNPIIINDKNMNESFYQCHISQRRIGPNDRISDELNILKKERSINLEEFIDKELLYHLNSDNLSNNEIEILIRLKRFLELKKLKEDIMNNYGKIFSIANQSADFTKFQVNGEIPWFSINSTNVSKGNGISILSEYLNIKKENRMSIGNDYNDRTMIDVTKIFACPQNSCSILLQNSSYIYDEKEGLDKLLKKVLTENGKSNC